MSTTALACIAAVATATAVIMFWMMRAAQRDAMVLRAQVRVANDTAESAVNTAKRMQDALRVVAEEISLAKEERRVAQRVIDEAQKTLAGSPSGKALGVAWDDLMRMRGKRDPDA